MKFLIILLFSILIHGYKFNKFWAKQYTKKVFSNSKLITCNNDCDIFVVLFPGYDKNPESYQELCEKIQNKTKETNVDVNFLLIDYLFTIPFNGDKQSKYISKDCKDFLESQNLTYSSLYFMGHSAGAYYTMSLAKNLSDGFIQMGNTLNSGGKLPWKSENLSSYPIPILTLLAQKDGLINPFLSDYEFENIDNTIHIDKSIVIEKDVDHYQMSDGVESVSSKIFKQKNIFSRISLQEAQDKLVNTISNFLTWPYNETLYNELYQKLNDSKSVIDEYRKLKNDNYNMIRYVQYKAINTDFFHPFPINVEEVENRIDFLVSRPELQKNGTFVAKYHLESYYNPFLPFLSKQCAIKLKGQDSLFTHENYRHLRVNKAVTAKEMNRHLIETQLLIKNIPFDSVNIVYLEDKECNEKTGTLEWLKNSVNITFVNKTKTLYIQSPVFKSYDYPVEKFSNLYYLKILTSQLAYEIVSLYF